MKNRFRTFAYSLILLFVYSLIPFQVHAVGEFQADYDVQYAVSPTGKTIVTQTVQLTNKLANFYPRQYSLLVDSDRISNVIAYDDGGVITPAISVKDGKTDIALSFNTKTIGLGKSSTFSLRYEHAGIASQNGNIWEIYVPGITNDPDIGTYNVTLSVPPTFGGAAYLSPQPSSGSTWTKDQMIRGGIAAAYGSKQYFDVELRYTISNPSVTTKNIGLALPPETAYQNVTLASLDPKPVSLERDIDGNWIAYYELLPAASRSIVAKTYVTTYLRPRESYQTQFSEDSAYLASTEYWQSSDPAIRALSDVYKTPALIYRYVSETLTYDYSKINAPSPRLGSLETLKLPESAVCTEFTDLFIAIARAAGIPARRNVGYAYTNNPKLRPLSLAADILHAWPEYYDRERGVWIPVDPTWANTTGGTDYFTKLDFNHIVFAINGVDDTLPYPAGFYRNPGSKSKDVSVEFASADVRPIPPKLTTRIEFPQQVASGRAATGNIIVTNEGGEPAYIIAVSARSDIGDVLVHEVIDELLPYATTRIPITANIPQSFRSGTGTIYASVNDAQVSSVFTIRPLIWLYAGAVVIAIVVILLTTRIVQIFLWKRSRNR